LVVDHEHRTGATLAHTLAGLLYRLVRGQDKRVLVCDNVCDRSVGHDASFSADALSLKINR
jgi:hypothetical protein